MTKIPCPYTYANGKRCPGYVAGVERYHVTAEWTYDVGADRWELGVWDDGTHFHLFCSEKGNHAGVRREDALKLWGRELPEELQRVVSGKEA